MRITHLKETVDDADAHEEGLLTQFELSLHLHEPVDGNGTHGSAHLLTFQVMWFDGHRNLEEKCIEAKLVKTQSQNKLVRHGHEAQLIKMTTMIITFCQSLL